MNESMISQVAALVTWPVVVLLGGLVFFWPLWNILKAFVGFIQRSRYCVGDAQTMGQICVKNVFSCRRDDKVQTKIREMNKCEFSFAPIVDGGECVCAVFTPQCIARIASGEAQVNQNTTFADLLEENPVIAKLADVKKFRFVALSDAGVVAGRHFHAKWKDKEDFDIFLVTEHGCASEPLKGVVSVWDSVTKLALDGIVRCDAVKFN